MIVEEKRGRVIRYAPRVVLFSCMLLAASCVTIFFALSQQEAVSLNRWHKTGLQNARRAVVADREIPIGHKITLKDVYETNTVSELLLSDSALCSDFAVGGAPFSKIERGAEITLDYFRQDVQHAMQTRQLERLKGQSALRVCSHRRVDPLAQEQVQTFFAIRDIPEGQPIDKSDMETRYLPAEKVPLNFADDQASVIGKLSKFGIEKGQIINFLDVESDNVFVATKDLKPGNVLTKTDFQSRKIAEGEIPPITAVGSETYFKGATVNASIECGEIIRLADLTLSK